MDENQLHQRHVSVPLQVTTAGAVHDAASNGTGTCREDNDNNNNNHHNNTNGADQSQANPSPSESSPPKPQRKRNKPSLSCETCTVKKTKCDRGRPLCFACVKRRSECHYSQLADLIEESHQSSEQSPRRKLKSTSSSASNSKPSTAERRYGPSLLEKAPSRSSTGSSPRLLSNIPFSHPTASNLFKAEHPFRYAIPGYPRLQSLSDSLRPIPSTPCIHLRWKLAGRCFIQGSL